MSGSSAISRRQKVSLDASSVEVEVLELTGSFESVQSTEGSETSAGISANAVREEEREFFQKARNCLSPGGLFRHVVHFYAERKLVIFFWIHFVSTIIIWFHFGLVKFEELKKTVPEGAPRYWMKRVIPAIEFGSMHAILFQMTLIPLTMSRYTIASLSDSIVDKIVPLNRTLRMHIHLGYVMISIVFFATALFFTFFGINCVEGDETFCAKFTSEIMITGYAILFMFLVVLGTSYFRHKIPYELFYAVHHIVFIMFFVTIAHTFDIEQRSGRKERSQTFMWFSSTLAFYMCDRAAMYINHWYDTKLQGSSVVTGSDGSRTILLRVKRPALLRFSPGQYVFLRMNKIDNFWHPFSIASCPDSSELEFYIEVYGEKSWTASLWSFLESKEGNSLRVEVMGPYGTSIAKPGSNSHVLAIGAGTGIVPVLSLFKAHVRDLLQLDPNRFFAEIKSRERKVRMMEIAEEAVKGSMISKAASGCKRDHGDHDRLVSRNNELSGVIRRSVNRHENLATDIEVKSNMKMMKKAASDATRSIWGVFFLASLPVMGITLFGLTVSWNTIPIDLHPNMMEILKIFTIVFQALFGVVALFIWDLKGILAFVDVAVVVASPFLDAHFFRICDTLGSLRPVDIFIYSLFVLYMTGRLWDKTVSPRHSTWQEASQLGSASKVVEKFTLVWTTKCASQVSALLPSIAAQWEILVSTWGLENALEACSISIHVTDTDETACNKLRSEICFTSLFLSGAIKFGRADLERVIENHSIDLVCTRSSSHSLLVFCGSPRLAGELHAYKISNDMILAITGSKKHQMDFIGECYGGPKRETSTIVSTDGKDDMESEVPLTTRKSMRYSSLRKNNSLNEILDLLPAGAKTSDDMGTNQQDKKNGTDSPHVRFGQTWEC